MTIDTIDTKTKSSSAWQLFMYLIMIGYIFIAMPKNDTTYLVARSVQAIESIFFISLIFKYFQQGINFNRFNNYTNSWWLFYTILTYTFASGMGLTPLFKWLNVIIFLLLERCYWQNDFKQSLYYIATTFSVLIYLNGLLLIIYPEGLWIDEEWVGRGDATRYLFGNYNQMGFVGLIGITTQAMYTLFTGKGKFNLFLIIIISIASVIFVGSMTSTMGLSVLALYIIFHKILKRPNVFLTVFVILYILFFVVIVWGGSSVDQIQFLATFVEDILTKDTTFSNRTEIWSNAVSLIEKKPWLGYGLQDVEWNDDHLGGSGPHNLWLMFLLQGGIVLLGSFLYIVIQVIKHAAKTVQPSTTVGIVSIFTLFMMSLFETYNIIQVFFLLQFTYHSSLLVTQQPDKEPLLQES